MRRLAAILLALASISCGTEIGSSGEPPRLVILYATCTVNKRFLSPYEPSVAFTPHLSDLAESSVVFERHQSEAGSSGIAFASIFSGSQSDVHGVYRHPMKLGEELHLVAEAYAESGYETYFWADHPMAGPKLGYGQGVPESRTFSGPLDPDSGAFAGILESLDRSPDYRAFVMTNFTVTHGTYKRGNIGEFLRQHPSERPALATGSIDSYYDIYRKNVGLTFDFPRTVARLGLSAREIEDLAAVIELAYKSRIHVLDRMVGEVLAQLRTHGVLDETMFVFTADHGEDMYREHAPFHWEHSMQLAPDVIGVPLVLHAPSTGLAPGRYPHVSRSIDVLPTMLGLSGIALPETARVQGVDLSPGLFRPEVAPALRAYSHSTIMVDAVHTRMQLEETRDNWAHFARGFPDDDPSTIWVAAREGDRVYKWTAWDGVWRRAVYDLASDPGEERDLYDAADDEQNEVFADLARYKERLVEAARPGIESGDRSKRLPTEAELERLRALGYIR